VSDIFDFTTEVPRFAVMGNPIAHSKSPRIHTSFGEQCGIALEYTAIQVDVGGFEQAVDGFKASGGRGLNVTVPFKSEAFDYADELSDDARIAGAVNTLVFADGEPVRGPNPAGSGLVRDIQEVLGVSLQSKRVLVIGAGGATRGVIKPIVDQGPKSLVIANRTPDRAAAVASDLNPHLAMTVTGCGLDDVAGERFDIVINATAASLEGAIPDIDSSVVDGADLVYDMMYAAEPTAFLRWGEAHGAQQIADGLGMLVEQAADAFALWLGQRPLTEALRPGLRDAS